MMDQTIGFGMMDLRTLPAVWGDKPSRKETQELGPVVKHGKTDQPQLVGLPVCVCVDMFIYTYIYDMIYVYADYI